VFGAGVSFGQGFLDDGSDGEREDGIRLLVVEAPNILEDDEGLPANENAQR
jgi:hypothetical protein